MKVAIIGSSHTDNEEVINKAKELGKVIALKDCTIITGGIDGYPDIVAQSALLSDGIVIAYCGGKNLGDHYRYYKVDLSKYSDTVFQENYIGDELSRIDLYFRSLKMCFDADMAIVIGGYVGTMYELTILAGMKKDIYVMESSGGITSNTIKVFLDEGLKEKSKIEFFNEVKEIEKYL